MRRPDEPGSTSRRRAASPELGESRVRLLSPAPHALPSPCLPEEAPAAGLSPPSSPVLNVGEALLVARAFRHDPPPTRSIGELFLGDTIAYAYEYRLALPGAPSRS